MAPSNFSIEGRAFSQGFRDIQRTWLWELVIDGLPALPGIKFDSDRLLVHCRSAVIPGRGTDMIESNFGGMKQFFTGKPNFPYTFGVNIEENEDQFVRKILNAWQEAIFGTSSKSPNQGYSAVSSIVSQKKGLCAKRMELQLYKVDGNPTDKKFSFVNGIIQNVGDVAVSYDDNSSVKYDCTFQYDFMEMLDK